MSPEETQVLLQTGRLLKFNVAHTIEICMLWGIHAMISLAAIASLWQRRQGFKFLIAALSAILILSTFDIVVVIIHLIRLIDHGILDDSRPFDEGRLARLDHKSLLGMLGQVNQYLAGSAGILYVVPDAVIVWRAWKIWMKSRLWLALPIILVVAATALSIAANAFITDINRPQSVPVGIATGASAAVCSLSANAITTGMIGWQAYQHRSRMSSTLGEPTGRAWRALFFVMEAGLVFLALQVINLVVGVLSAVSPNPPDVTATEAWMNLVRWFSLTYAALIVLIVSHNRSIARDTDSASQISFDVGTHVSFAQSASVSSSYARTTGSTKAARDNTKPGHNRASSHLPIQLQDRSLTSYFRKDKEDAISDHGSLEDKGT